MSAQQDNKTIVALLEQAIGQEFGARAEYNEYGQLITLDLSILDLTFLPPELSQLSNLQQLDLSYNHLTQTPVELAQLRNLQTLRLDDNQLTQVPVELGRLSKLQYLYLNNNQLTQVPIELTRLSHLQTLRLDNNQLTQVPETWIEVEQELVDNAAHHISADTYIDLCEKHGIQATLAQGTLGSYLHDLGKILYFRDDPILRDLVILKPNWVTKAISLVLEDEAPKNREGILEHTELAHIWAADEQGQPYASALHPIFLRLMERFDLSYQIEPAWSGLPVTRSLIPQLLPYQPPSSLPAWSPQDRSTGKVHVEMTYRLDFLPAGIMSWFIVRTHRYTHHLHWREGAVLTYKGHFARIELFPRRNEIHKEVDPYERWDGLERVTTEDGNIFWLCEEHARPYRVQALQTR